MTSSSKHSDRTWMTLVTRVVLFEVLWWLLTGLIYVSLGVGNAGGVTLLHPMWCAAWLVIPVILAVYVVRWKWKSTLHEQYRGMGRTRMLWVTFQPLRYFLQYFFFRSVIFFLVLALTQPVMGNRKVKGSRRVLDLVICLDVSSSMNTMDIADNTTRLTVAKRGIVQLLNNLRGERIAVVIFANEAYTQLPLTMDYGAAKQFVQEIETSMVSNQGTNVGAALEMAQTQFVDSESGHAVIVITDGEDHEQLWKEQVAELKEKHVELSYYGIGTEKGGLIPVDPLDPQAGYKRDGGSAVVSKLDRAGLQSMAAASDCPVYFSDDAFPDMTAAASDIKAAKSKVVSDMEFTVEKNYYQVPLFLALCCLAGYLFVPFFVNRKQS